MWNAFPAGQFVDLGPVTPSRPGSGAGDNAPKDGDTWGPERTVRAKVIASLLLGAREAGGGSVPAVRLRGARITGQLTLVGGTVPYELVMSGCHLEQPVQLTGATTRTIRLTDCALPGLSGGGLRVAGHVSLSGSNITGTVRVARAVFESGLWLGGTKIVSDDGEWALYANATVVDSGLFLRNADCEGGVSLVGARLNGGCFMEGATLRNPGKDALTADNVVVEDVMRLTDGFRAEGCIRLRGARINGRFALRGTVTSPDTRYALHMSYTEIREASLLPAAPIDGVVTLAHSKLGTLHDDPDTWPAKLRLNGLTYERLRGHGVVRRIEWVTRDPEGFRPQPYEQLAAWYLGDGNDALARRAQLAKLRARRQTQGVGGRVWGRLLDVAVGYGYRPWLAGMWFALLLAIGTAVFAAVPPRALKPDESPHFNAFAYAFDLLLPLPAFGQREAFDPMGWTQWLAYGLIVAGWILATALVAGATRVLRPQ
ncbi:hypothetical protein MF672_013260 [Actinomadura sp. ATCC 31491]|uniref:Oxidoreductase n=1 Tax=Actinomadura luzonensis TaxID=2805427 RepID=A0ABT0FRW4_9ACTN|nr:hypothetical protein [Actinomadura luzonensis]MCK2214755.1 hypothetical protein [Actinomadura luzonensis]